MIDAVQRLAGWFRDPSHLLGLAAFGLYFAAVHAAVGWLVPGANLGTDIGICMFAVLTVISVENAKSYRSAGFAAWIVAGLIVSIVVGAVCQSLGTKP